MGLGRDITLSLYFSSPAVQSVYAAVWCVPAGIALVVATPCAGVERRTGF